MNINFEEYDLGMHRGGEVHLVEHSNRWAKCFSLVSQQMVDALAPYSIELHHIGSTAIPNIKAKPILDILGTVTSIKELDEQQKQFENLGFTWKGEYGINGRRYCVKYDISQNIGYIHLHIFEKSHPEVKEHILFRDYLCNFPDQALEYNKLKESLFNKFSSDRQQYTNSKDSFIKDTLKKAKL